MATKSVLTGRSLKKAFKDLEFFTSTPKESKLTAAFTFSSHVEALVFIARITVHAEVLQHHPDISFTFKSVKISLTTTEEKGITKKDVDLAKRIERLAKH